MKKMPEHFSYETSDVKMWNPGGCYIVLKRIMYFLVYTVGLNKFHIGCKSYWTAFFSKIDSSFTLFLVLDIDLFY